jgi:NADH-quinone oxidoreductase subunit L
MEAVLCPLALLGLSGGMLNLPEYLGGGWLGHFLGSANAGSGRQGTELLLQGVAASVVIAGLLFVHARYGGARREKAIAAADAPSGVTLFFRSGWRFDDLYRLLFIRPYGLLARFFWERVDEEGIDGSLDRLAGLLGRTGRGLGRWTTGRVSVYLLSMAAGLALMMVYLAWMVW